MNAGREHPDPHEQRNSLLFAAKQLKAGEIVSPQSRLGGLQNRNVLMAVATIVTVVLAGVIVFLIYNTVHHDNKKKNASPVQATQSAPQLPSNSVNPSGPHNTQNPGAGISLAPENDPKAAEVAAKFAQAWVRKDLSQKEWLANISKYCSGDLTDSIRDMRPEKITDSHVTGDPQTTSLTPLIGTFTVPLDQETLTVYLSYYGHDGWLVTSMDSMRGDNG